LEAEYAETKNYSWLVYVVRYARQVVNNDGEYYWHRERRRWERG